MSRPQSSVAPLRNEPELVRAMGLPQATAMVVGIIIGSAIFMQPSEVTAKLPSVGGILLAWLLSGVLTLFGAIVCAELAATFPNSGGVYVFLREIFGRPLAFLWGWAMFWTMHSGIIAAIAVGFARYLGYLLPLESIDWRVASLLGLAAQSPAWANAPQRLRPFSFSLINALGVKQGSTLQTGLTAIKLLAVLVIIVAAFALGAGNPNAALRSQPLFDLSGVSLHEFGLAMVAGLFAFGGWHMVTYSAGETIDPRRTIPRALLIGTLIVTACYIALNAAYLYVLPLNAVANSKAIAADAADAVVGPWGGRAMAVLVVISTFGAVAGVILTGPRVYYAMAHDGVLFRSLGNLHPRWRTPTRVIAAQAVWSSVLVATGTYSTVVDRVVYTEWIFFGLMAIGLILWRRRQNASATGGLAAGFCRLAIPVVFAASSFAIVANKIVSKPWECLTGLAFVIAGLPVYYLWVYLMPTQNKQATENTEVTE